MITTDTLRKILIANELGGDTTLVYKFSPPCSDGSGWTFGVCQFDVRTNPEALQCLRNCGFTSEEVRIVHEDDGDVEALTPKLVPRVIDQWDNKELQSCIDTPKKLCDSAGIEFADDEAFYHLADYHNQFHMAPGGKMDKFLQSLGRPVAAQDILKLKLSTRWGQGHAPDVYRRYNNIHRICAV